jgi:hypothetical protein
MQHEMMTRIASAGDARGASRLHDRSGLALIATLMLIALIAVLTTAALSGALSSLRTASSDYEDTRVFYAAEAGGEATLAQLKIALQDGYLSDDELASIRPPTLRGISFDSFLVRKVGSTYNETITDGPYAGLTALTQDVEIYSRATNSKGDMAAVILRTKAQAIPVFQFGVFFEQDLEATNGPPMEFVGRVHSNGNIYLSSNNAWYRDLVTTPNKIFHDRKDFHSIKNGVFINDASGAEVMLDFDSRTHPDPDAFKAESCAKFDCRVMTDAFGVDSLKLPLPDGVPTYELVRPREATDTEAEKTVKFAWNADMYVTVDLTDIRTKQEVCATGGPKKDPDELTGDLQMTALQPVIPANRIQFKILGIPCGQVSGLTVEVKADGVTIWTTSNLNSCVFDVDVPADADLLEVVVSGWINGTASWWALQSVNDLTPWPATTVTRDAGLEVPTPYHMCNMLWWKWSAFYDGREDELKDVFNIDVAQLGFWAAGNPNRRAELIYVEFILPNGLATYPQDALDLMPDGSLDPAVRVVNGQTLPNRLTVASEWPLYVRGDYNRIAKQPAALAGDGITILSSAWDDVQNRPDDGLFGNCRGLISQGSPCPQYVTWAANWSYQNAGETTVNAAILAGHWPTPCDHEDASCSADGTTAYYSDWYGGGLENFPRFLERWRTSSGSRVIFRYLGALVSPFTSQKTTGTWNGSYYVPPQRDWSFDTDFRDPNLLPPGTPNVGYVIRTAMREAY